MDAAILVEPVHVAMSASVKKFTQTRTCRPRITRGRDADGVEPKKARLGFQAFRVRAHALPMAPRASGVDRVSAAR